MRKTIFIYFILAVAVVLTACGTNSKSRHTVYVSIPPLRYMVEQIVDPDIRVEVLVPETGSPETYEPTPRQIQALVSSPVYIATGLIDFEQILEHNIQDMAANTVYLDLSSEMELIHGTCSHSGRHHHAVDPHIWLSPVIMKEMGFKTADLLSRLDPGSADDYQNRAALFAEKIDTLDQYIQNVLTDTKRRSFAIGHSSLTYFARDYGLEQIAVEADGKEPGAKAMTELVDSLKSKGITTVFYQRQTADAAAKAIARELPGGQTVAYDPLAEDWLDNMYRLADMLKESLNN